MVGTKACGVAKRDLDFELEGAAFLFLLQVHGLGELGQSLSLSESRFHHETNGGADWIISKSLYPALGVYDSNVCITFYILLVTFP